MSVFVNESLNMVQTEAVERAISEERFAPYVFASFGENTEALALYELNTRVSASLYGPMQALEVALRNSFHAALTDAYGQWWFDRGDVIWELFQRRRLAEAHLDLVQNKKLLTPGRVVASLTFGFWTACLANPYDDVLWRRGGLGKTFAAGGAKPKRSHVNRKLNPLRQIRNRIAHHEPILHFDLPKHHANIVEILGWLNPAVSDWAAAQSPFHNAYDVEAAAKMIAARDRQKQQGKQDA
ncbi:MAG: hypothetical protein ACK4GG_11545 [Sphingomonas sp.]